MRTIVELMCQGRFGEVEERFAPRLAAVVTADLAWGLASRGIAVVRFDKPSGSVTMTDEYVPHAVAAVRLLQREGVGPVFVAGHSMGGKVAPRVAAAEASVAGLVLLAARVCL